MGFILQTQRMAIESLKPYAPEPFWPSDLFLEPSGDFWKKDIGFRIAPKGCVGTSALYFYGISGWIGSSDIHGMDVAVFGYRPTEKSFLEFEWLRRRLPQCVYAVLLWPSDVVPLRTSSSEEATKIDSDLHDPTEPVQVVELIACHDYSHGNTWTTKYGDILILLLYFHRTGVLSTYNRTGVLSTYKSIC